MPPKLELSNKKFGKLLAIRAVFINKDKNVWWECKCDCGNFINVKGCRLKKGTTKSCGCIKNENLVGKRFNKLLIIEKAKYRGSPKNRKQYWLCLCDCGTKKEISLSAIKSGQISCGCIKLTNRIKPHKKSKRFEDYEELYGVYWNSLFLQAKNSEREFTIDQKYVYDIFIKQKRKCAISGLPIYFAQITKEKQTASLDRIDSTKGYIKGNVQWVHKDINKLKSNWVEKKFIDLCNLISKNNSRSNFDEKWDLRFLGMAKHISEWSYDKSTGVGSVIVDKHRRVISTGYNGFPQGVNDNPERYQDREWKLAAILHSEINCLLFAKQDLSNCTIFTWPFMPCSNCAAAIIQAGITRVVAPKTPEDKLTRWFKSFETAMELFEEAGVELKLYDIQ